MAPLPDVTIVTQASHPEPMPDDGLLVRALEDRELVVEARAWTDPRRPWTRAPLTVVRSPWDYPTRRPKFLRWIDRVQRGSTLWNPAPTLRWNTDKSYLARFARRGIPVVPSRTVRPGRTPRWERLVAGLGNDRIVVKPTVSADGFLTEIIAVGDRSAGERHLARVLGHGPALVQRYLPSVESMGERSLIYLDGRYSHAIRRTPILLPGGRGRPEPAAVPPRGARRLADAVARLAGVSELLYARIDVVPDPEGRWRLLEAELTEPSLYLAQHPKAPTRLADGILRRLGAARHRHPTVPSGSAGTARPGPRRAPSS